MKNEFQLPVLWMLNSFQKASWCLCENASMSMHAMNESLVDNVTTGKRSSEPAWPTGQRMFLLVLSVNNKLVQWLHEQTCRLLNLTKEQLSVVCRCRVQSLLFHKQSHFAKSVVE